MTKSISQNPQYNETISSKKQTKTVIQGNPKTTPSVYTPDSLWVNVRYGFGMLSFIIIPPLIPGATIKSLIIGYMSLICGVYIAAAITSLVRTRHPIQHYTRGRR